MAGQVTTSGLLPIKRFFAVIAEVPTADIMKVISAASIIFHPQQVVHYIRMKLRELVSSVYQG